MKGSGLTLMAVSSLVMFLSYRLGAEVKWEVSVPDNPDMIDSEVSLGTIRNLIQHRMQRVGDDSRGALLGSGDSDSPRPILADTALLAVSLCHERPAHGHITGSALSGTCKPDGIATLVTQELGDGITGNGKLRHGVSPKRFCC